MAVDTSQKDPDARDLSYLWHRRLIGCLGLSLPFLLVAVAALRPTPGLPSREILDSISAYYYTGAVSIFVGVLFALSLFLFTYQGYRGSRADRRLGAIGGICALGVALFPTAAPEGLDPPAWWSEMTRTIHYGSAVCLFLVFIAFSVWLFRKSSVPKDEEASRDKQWRNRFYLGCGGVMIASVLWAGTSLITDRPIFWPEAIALLAFASSWLVKGEAHRPVIRIAKKVARR